MPNVFVNKIKHCSKSGRKKEVLALFRQMQEQLGSSNIDASLYPIAIKILEKHGVLLHSRLIKAGLDREKYARNAMLNAYGRYEPVEKARRVFDEMPERGVADFNAMISCYWNSGREGEARALFEAAPEKNVITWTSMVTGYAKTGDSARARWYFDRTPDKSVVSWNAMITAYAHGGRSEEALSLFDEMARAGVAPDETTSAAVISSCSSCNEIALAERVVEMLGERGVGPNEYVRTALLDLYAKCGLVEKAREIFDELAEHGNTVTWNSMISAYARAGDLASARDLFDRMLEKDVISWNSMIAGYAQNGRSLHSVELFREMIEEGKVKPDEVTMVSLISACGHLGALELGNWVVDFVARNRIELSASGYNSLIFMYSKCGNMDKANRLFREMEARDVVSYNALITGFAAHGNGLEALNLMREMKNEGIEPNRVTYIVVLTACSHAGLLERGREVFESIEDPDIDHYGCMVDLLARVGKLDEAKKTIEAMPMRPNAGVYGPLLNASRIHRRVDLGEFSANKLFELEPENPGNYILLSNIYASVGEWKEVDRIRETMKTRGVTKTAAMSWVEYGGTIHKFGVGDRSHEKSRQIYDILAKWKKEISADYGYVADKSSVLRDVEEEEKEEMVGTHSEKLAVAFAVLVGEPKAVVRVTKNLRICRDCHAAIKMISRLEGREIIVRDNNRFHRFKDGACSCGDYCYLASTMRS